VPGTQRHAVSLDATAHAPRHAGGPDVPARAVDTNERALGFELPTQGDQSIEVVTPLPDKRLAPANKLNPIGLRSCDRALLAMCELALRRAIDPEQLNHARDGSHAAFRSMESLGAISG
jgi:hypothetical protein